MKYKDEEIVRLRNYEKKRKYVNSETGMYVGESLIKFCPMKIFQQYSIKLPESFREMDLKIAQKKYPSINRPQLIFTNEKGTVNFTFNLFDQTMGEGTTEGALEQFKVVIKSIQPSSSFMGNGSLDGIRYHSSWMGFHSTSLDGEVYNLLSLTRLESKFILGMFNCPKQEWMLWKMLMLEVLSTINSGEDENE